MIDPCCDFAGFVLDELDDFLAAPCGKPATHRYRMPGHPDAEWRYRCAEDVFMLPPHVVVEKIGDTR